MVTQYFLTGVQFYVAVRIIYRGAYFGGFIAFEKLKY